MQIYAFIKSLFAGCFYYLAGIATSAQFNKGDKMVGASVASIFFNSGNADISVASVGNNISKITSYGVSITPSVGWFISEKLLLEQRLILIPTVKKPPMSKMAALTRAINPMDLISVSVVLSGIIFPATIHGSLWSV